MKENIYAYTEITEAYYPAFISINKDDDEVTIMVRSRHVLDSSVSTIDMPKDRLIEMAKSVLKFEEVVSDQPAMTHFLALMEGLKIPHPEWWLTQPPGMLGLVGKYIAKQAQEVYDAEQRNEQSKGE